MDEKRYLISDAAKAVQAEPHVLRYWEDELELSDPEDGAGASLLYRGRYSDLSEY